MRAEANRSKEPRPAKQWTMRICCPNDSKTPLFVRQFPFCGGDGRNNRTRTQAQTRKADVQSDNQPTRNRK